MDPTHSTPSERSHMLDGSVYGKGKSMRIENRSVGAREEVGRG